MEVKPIHILGASIAAFFVIVAANIVVSYQRNANFRERFSKIDFSTIRPKLVAQEQMSVVEDIAEEVEAD